MKEYRELSVNELFWGADHFPYAWEDEEDKTIIRLKSRRHSCACPHCGCASDHRSATYERVLQDIPRTGAGRPTYLAVRAYKYSCVNPECPVKTFNEVLPFAHGLQRRTDALNELILAVSLFMSAEGASQVLGRIGVQVSNDAIERLWSRVTFADRPEVTDVGVDDVSIRKGQTYATVVYDKEDGALLALLDGRDGNELRKWLKDHPRIEHVARDRASAYAKVISEILPECVQVADRYHLFANLSEHLRSYFLTEMPLRVYLKDGKVCDAPESAGKCVYKEKRVDVSGLHYDTDPPLDANGRPIEIDAQRHSASTRQAKANAESRHRKKEIVLRAQELYRQGKNYSQIARELGIGHSTAKKYVQMEAETLDVAARRAPRKNRKGEECFPIIYKMMAAGHDDVTILSYLRSHGYDYALGTLHNRIAAISENHFPDRKRTTHPNKLLTIEASEDLPDGMKSYRRMEIFYASLTVNHKKLSAKQDLVNALPAIMQVYPAAAEIQQAMLDFRNALASDSVQSFIDAYTSTFLSGFCHGLKLDFDAVAKAATSSLNSGWVEGSNNKFKLVKRTMYGRAGLPTLSKKSIAAFSVLKSNDRLSDLIHYSLRKRMAYSTQRVS